MSSIRQYISIVENLFESENPSDKDWSDKHLWIAGDAETMEQLMKRHVPKEACFSETPDKALSRFEQVQDIEQTEHEPVVLEFKLCEDANRENVDEEDGCVFVHDPNCIKFVRVYSGVIHDALTDGIDPNLLDEVALGGLQRCTSVTCNALFKAFHKQPITLAEVPETDVGVLQILSKRGLSYKPVPNAVGRTVQQFVALNRRGAFYVCTPGHAIAVINSEIFDAENRGPDGRKIQMAYLVTDR